MNGQTSIKKPLRLLIFGAAICLAVGILFDATGILGLVSLGVALLFLIGMAIRW
ncbi:MAG: hypothetical protein JXB85_03520 [Anaerolineales bacterium]|nr:hypothetical protein [Anaerolineales bacterium]